MFLNQVNKIVVGVNQPKGVNKGKQSGMDDSLRAGRILRVFNLFIEQLSIFKNKINSKVFNFLIKTSGF